MRDVFTRTCDAFTGITLNLCVLCVFVGYNFEILETPLRGFELCIFYN
jgi:hypothetical protein